MNPDVPATSRTSPAALVASVFGLGYLPVAPGTWCSVAVALPAILIPADIATLQYVYLALAVVFGLLGLWSVPRVQTGWGSDPSAVVIDEAMGMSLVLVLPYAYMSVWWWFGGIVLFRLFDIRKPWPLSVINRRTEAWSVMADDALAGCLAALCLHLGFIALQVVLVSLVVSNGRPLP